MAKKLDRLYIRVDAHFPSDEKYQALPYKIRDSAYLFFEALNGWSRDKKTDGRVPLAMAHVIGGSMGHASPKVFALIATLVHVGLLESSSDQVFIRKYGKWQDTREEIERYSAAGRKGGQASGRARSASADEALVDESSTNRQAKRGRIVDDGLNESSSQTETETETETETVVASNEATSSAVGGGDSGAIKEPEREDVDQLCTAMADSVEERGERRPRITAEWRRQARLMLDSDHRPLDEALELVAWLARDPFWSANVLSLPKFREQYPKLRLQHKTPVRRLPLSPEVQERAKELDGGCSGILARPLKAAERDLVLRWASTLRRGGELVAVPEVLDTVVREMGRPTPEGSLPVNLAWCADAVATLARERASPATGAAGERLTPNSQLARQIEASLRQRQGGATP